MIRDFTEIVQEEMHDAIKDSLSDQVIYSSHNYTFESELTATVEILGQDCVVNFSDLEAYAENMKIQTRNSVSEQSSMISKLDAIFTDARNHDDEKAINVNDEKTITADVYINTLRDLAESISVSSLGKGATSVRYNYSRFHSSFEDSIFGSSDAFAGKMDSIGGGLLKEFFDSINAVEPFNEHSTEVNNLYEFLKKDPNEVKDWERDAILMYLDSCVTVDESTGYSTVNYERVSMILSGCYTQEEYTSINVFRPYTKYYANDMLTYLATEYNNYYQFKASFYQYMHPEIQKYADLNAILLATNYYYKELHLNSTTEVNELGEIEVVNFGLNVYEEEKEPHRIVINTVQVEDDEFEYHLKLDEKDPIYNHSKHNIYIMQANTTMYWTKSMETKYKNGKVRVEDACVEKLLGNMKTKGTDKVLGSMKNAGPGGVIAVKAYKEASALYNVYDGAKRQNAICDENIGVEKNRRYTEHLCIGGQTACCGDNPVISLNGKVNERELQVKVAAYNLNHPDLTPITEEEVVKGYENFVAGSTESQEILEDFSNSMETPIDEGSESEEHDKNSTNLQTFRDKIVVYVYDKYGIGLKDATKEQVEDAINNYNSIY